VTGDEKRAFLESLDILVFAGTQPEGLPLVVLEGMAAGRAIVATPVGAIPDAVVPGETGVLVPAGDRTALAGAVSMLAADPETRRRMGAAGRRRYLEHYTDERCIERMVSLFTTGADG
jgi:glycosyltransferase involved in cell wall biosynthesis